MHCPQLKNVNQINEYTNSFNKETVVLGMILNKDGDKINKHYFPDFIQIKSKVKTKVLNSLTR